MDTQQSLFADPAPDPAPEPKEWSAPDVMSLAARRRYGLSDSWRWMQSEVVDMKIKSSDFLLHMIDASTVGVFKSGPRKGETKWPALKECRRIIISRADIDAAEAAWESERGVCYVCGGKGSDPLASSPRSCHRCKGTGKPKAPVTP